MKKPIKIVFLDASTLGEAENLSPLKFLGEFTSYDFTTPGQRIERIKKHNVVITNKVVIDREVMDKCPELELVCIAATGMNNVDLSYAEEKGITVKNVAGYSTESVAQSTFSMLFYLLHGSAYYNEYVQSGKYSASPVFTNHGHVYWELNNKTFGIIGMGAIGRRVAKIAEAFGAQVVYHSTSGKNLHASSYQHLPLSDLLVLSDVISIHCPLNDKTRNLLDEKHLRMMKPTAYLLNMGRGGIVDEAALARVIDDNIIAGAGLDVLTSEPINPDNPLLKIKNKHKIFITPHIAWASREARRLLVEKTAKNISSYFGIQTGRPAV